MVVKKITSDIPEEIERVALLGWRVHPCSRSSRAAMFKNAAEHSSCDLDVIARWVDFYPRCNWRVVMQGSGILALDLDVPGPDHTADGIAAFRALRPVGSDLADMPMIRTGGGGIVMFFADNGEVIAGRSGYPRPGIDPKRGPLTVTLPPSVHHRTRLPYMWLRSPWACTAPRMPAWLARALRPPEKPAYVPGPAVAGPEAGLRALAMAERSVAAAGQGARNETLNRWAFILGLRMREGQLSEAQVRQCLMAAADGIGLDWRSARDTIDSGIRAAQKVWRA